jgi:hypothetical protein
MRIGVKAKPLAVQGAEGYKSTGGKWKGKRK